AALDADRLARVGNEVSHATTSCALPGVLDGRLCVTRSQGSCSIVIRILPHANLANLAAEAGVPRALVDAAFATSGLVVVTGPARSGKTTTQYALLSELNDRRACHIATVEHVIGMRIPPREAVVQQREIGIDVSDCLGGIQASLAQGADVLMVGEIRSVGAIALMIEHVDHTTRHQLARSLRAVGAQQLIRTADGDGHVAAFGLLVPDDAMRRAIVDGTPVLDREPPLPEGCQAIRDDIDRLLREGAIADADAADALASLG
ncbi:MAG: ATPase, T2SS/T4P/T4SS family, partial [Planctomycetota bacterium]